MHSCPKKTSEAMFDWMVTTALKTLINSILLTFTDIQEYSLGCLFLFQKYKVTPLFFDFKYQFQLYLEKYQINSYSG